MKKLLLAFMLWMGITGTAYAANYGQMLYGSTTYPYNTYFSTGSNGTCLTSNGTIPVWGSCGGGGTPGGSNGQLQYNNAGSFAGTSSPVVGYITATSTTASSTLPTLSSSNFFTNAIALGASAISYIQSLFTGGTGISVSGGTITNTGVTSLGSVTGAIATGTITCSGTASCGAGSYVLGSNLTITGAGSATGIGTSSPWTVGNLAYVSSQGAVSSVGTTSLTATSPLSLSQPISVIGSSASALTCPTCNTSNASVSSVGLSSTNSTLTIGSTPVTTSGTITADLNLSHSNTWVAGQTFGNATTTNLSVTGNVGVGTTNPLKPFHVLESTSNGVALFERSTSGTFGGFTTFLMQADASGTPSNGFGPSFDFYANNTTNTLGNKIGFVQAYTDNNSTTTGDLEFYTVNAGVNTPMMVMLYNGKTGIGTTTPATTLDVNGDITDESVKSQGCIGTDSTGKIINGTCSGTNYFTNSGATTTLTTGSVLQATTASSTNLCLGGTCITTFGAGTNYFSNTAGTTTLTTGTNLVAKVINATSSINVNAGGYYQINGSNFLFGSTTLSNYFMGSGEGNLTSTGVDNFGIGDTAMSALTSGSNNVGIGHYANHDINTGFNNIAIGDSTLENNSAGNANIGIGENALQNVTGSENLAIGPLALNQEQNAAGNIAIGFEGLYNDTTGGSNTIIGQNTGVQVTTGAANISIGDSSLYNNSTGNDNVTLGYQNSYNNATSSNNVIIGYNAGYGAGGTYSNTGNTALGHQVGFNFQTGSNYNTLIGYQSGYDLTTGAYNIAIGNNVDEASNTASRQLNIGNVLYGTNMYNGGGGSATPINTGTISIGTTSATATFNVGGSALIYATTTLSKLGSHYGTGGSTAIPCVYDAAGDIGYITISSLVISGSCVAP